MKDKAINFFEKSHSNDIKNARKFVNNLKRERGIYAVAHFDLISSTKKMIKDQEKTIKEMLLHNRICRKLIQKNGGIVIKEMGDAILATFPNSPKACQCALNIIHNFQKYGKGICTKVTITAGTIEKILTAKEHDVYGVPVNLCNRMSKFTTKDSIVIEEKRFSDIKSWLPENRRVTYSKSKKVTLADFGSTSIRTITLKK